MPTLAENMPIFHGLKTARACLLALSLYRVVALRVRILPSAPVVIEIDRPLEVLGVEPLIKSDYASLTVAGCSVVWKVEGATP